MLSLEPNISSLFNSGVFLSDISSVCIMTQVTLFNRLLERSQLKWVHLSLNRLKSFSVFKAFVNSVNYILDTDAVVLSEELFDQHIIGDWQLLTFLLQKTSFPDEIIHDSFGWVTKSEIVLYDHELLQSFDISMKKHGIIYFS